MEMHCLDSLDIYEHISFFIDFSIEVIVFTGTLHLLHIEFLIKPYFHSTVQYCKHVHNVITEHQPEKPWKHNFCLYQWSLVEERWASSYTTPQHRITWPQSAEIHSDLQCSINTHTHTHNVVQLYKDCPPTFLSSWETSIPVRGINTDTVAVTTSIICLGRAAW